MRKAWGGRKVRAGVALLCTVAAVFAAVTVATGSDDDSASPGAATRSATEGEQSPGSDWVSTHERVLKHEALPCTGPKDPINFEIFSAGPAVAGIPLTDFTRRCGEITPADEPPANFTNYIYGSCKIVEGATGCEPPLEIQTWPACQRALGDYSFEGKPIPYRRLQSRGGAEVVEINFMLDHRIEVYTRSSTIVLFAKEPAIAQKALNQLRFQPPGNPPATKPGELKGQPDEGLAPPSDGATEGELQCQ